MRFLQLILGKPRGCFKPFVSDSVLGGFGWAQLLERKGSDTLGLGAKVQAQRVGRTISIIFNHICYQSEGDSSWQQLNQTQDNAKEN